MRVSSVPVGNRGGGSQLYHFNNSTFDLTFANLIFPGLQLYFTWQKAGMKIDYLWSHFCHPQEDLNITIRILLLEQKFWFLLKINLTCVKETRIRTHRVMNKIDFCERWFFHNFLSVFETMLPCFSLQRRRRRSTSPEYIVPSFMIMLAPLIYFGISAYKIFILSLKSQTLVRTPNQRHFIKTSLLIVNCHPLFCSFHQAYDTISPSNLHRLLNKVLKVIKWIYF